MCRNGERRKLLKPVTIMNRVNNVLWQIPRPELMNRYYRTSKPIHKHLGGLRGQVYVSYSEAEMRKECKVGLTWGASDDVQHGIVQCAKHSASG